GPTALDEAREFFREQAAALRDGGVDLIIIETISNIAEVEQAILAVRDVCTLPIIAQMTIGNDHRTIYGDTPATIARRMDAAGAHQDHARRRAAALAAAVLRRHRTRDEREEERRRGAVADGHALELGPQDRRRRVRDDDRDRAAEGAEPRGDGEVGAVDQG